MKLQASLALFTSLTLAAIDLGHGFVAETEVVLPGHDQGLGTAPSGYHSVPLRWFGQLFQDGPNITVVGANLKHVTQYLESLNPNFLQVGRADRIRRLAKRYEYVCATHGSSPGTHKILILPI